MKIEKLMEQETSCGVFVIRENLIMGSLLEIYTKSDYIVNKMRKIILRMYLKGFYAVIILLYVIVI